MELDPEGLAAGLDPNDVAIAKLLGLALFNIDRIIFGEQAIKQPIMLATVFNRFDDNASYHPPSDDQDELYCVYVPRLKAKLTEFTNAHNLILVTFFGTAACIETSCLAVACHEVRHRLQYYRRNDMRFFVNERQSSRDLLLDKVLKMLWLEFKEKKRLMYGRGDKRALIEYRAGDMEFDAQIVESLYFARSGEAAPSTVEALESFIREIVLVEPH